MVFCNMNKEEFMKKYVPVTILILVDGFLQYKVLMDASSAYPSQSLF